MRNTLSNTLNGKTIEGKKERKVLFFKRTDFIILLTVYSSSFSVFSLTASSLFFFVNSITFGIISFQNATLSGLNLRSTLGFKSRTRYACSFSVKWGHVTSAVPESGGFGDLGKEEIH